jgi:Uncharacterized conserved protein (COG2071)
MVGTIERRLLVNYRVEVEAIRRMLPAPFRPQVVSGVSMAGICMIRLGALRPDGAPRAVGIRTENAAHRVAVEWTRRDGPSRGVYIPRRDSTSRLTVLLGGRLFPGEHHHARFEVHEREGRFDVAFTSVDGSAHAAVTAELANDLPAGSVFSSLEEASVFFAESPVGYSATRRPQRFDGLELRCHRWSIQPLLVNHAESSFFDDESLFPAGTAELDSAFLMRDIPATWRARSGLDNQLEDGPVVTPSGPS